MAEKGEGVSTLGARAMACGPQNHDLHSLASPSLFVPGPPQGPGTREPGEAIHVDTQGPGTREPGEAIHVNRQGAGTRLPGHGAVEPAQHHITSSMWHVEPRLPPVWKRCTQTQEWATRGALAPIALILLCMRAL